jgi:peptidoglycan/xylan/chitin deacetylase (PgdA/CDA1 family)
MRFQRLGKISNSIFGEDLFEAFPIRPVTKPQPKLDYGAFVLSFDFELHWGVRDHSAPQGSYRQNLLGARTAIPRLLSLFERYGIAATWATVGFLFAETRKELHRYKPLIRPRYDDAALNPYREPIGNGEKDDQLHYGASLVDLIRQSPAQEIATHTFSHYYCLEPGQNRAAFAADIRSAVAIAAEKGIELRSIVFPRNQVNPAYNSVLSQSGISCYRGAENGWMYKAGSKAENKATKRAARLADSYFGDASSQVVKWSEVLQADGLCNVRGSRFLRPVSAKLGPLEKMRLNRITSEMNAAAEKNGIYHLWLHPHNVGVNTDANLDFLEQVLVAFDACRTRLGMKSLTMNSVAQRATEYAQAQAASNSGLIIPAKHSDAASTQQQVQA